MTPTAPASPGAISTSIAQLNDAVASLQDEGTLSSGAAVVVQASQPDKMLRIQLAASFNASVIAALATTPFDVIKTRLQLMDPKRAIARCTFPEATSAPFASRCNQIQLFQLCACGGQVGGITNSPQRPSSIVLMQSMVRKEGVWSLWRGTGIAIVTAFPSVGIYLTMYDQLKAKLNMVFNKDATPLVAGGAARAVSVVLTNPLEVIRTRVMAEHSTKQNSWLQVTRAALQQDGIMALWRGLVPTLCRDVPFSAMYWLLAEATRTRAAAYLRKSQDMSEISEIGKARGTDLSYRQTIGINLMAGVVGGSLASVITHPFDVIKTRAQVNAQRPQPTIMVLREMIGKEGWGALWGGVGPRVLKVAPSCAIVLASYEFFKRRWG
mmetsp:Transcript_43451/g.102609  ORF Transcript_43451/g.102609 Transcript_43451/m.102609 type:complete len:381 (+) Transcript_43451:118-1260(+)